MSFNVIRENKVLSKISESTVYNLLHGPRKSSRDQSHIVWQVCLLIWRLSFCTLSFGGLSSPLIKKCFSILNLFEAVRLTIKTKVFADETNS